MNGCYEFDCIDCKAHVFSYGYEGKPNPNRCSVCQWIKDIEITEEEKEALRKRFDKWNEEDENQN